MYIKSAQVGVTKYIILTVQLLAIGHTSYAKIDYNEYFMYR